MSMIYIENVLRDNIARCEDIIWDIENKDVFDKTDGQILGVLEVAKTIRASLTGLKSQLYPVLYPNKATTENIGDK